MNMSYTQNLEIYKQSSNKMFTLYVLFIDFGKHNFDSNSYTVSKKRFTILKFATINFRHLLCLVQDNGFKKL